MGEQQVLPESEAKPVEEPVSFGEHILQFFAYSHLPPHLQAVSEPFAALASAIVSTLPKNAERTVALRKLLESKDCAIRAKISHA